MEERLFDKINVQSVKYNKLSLATLIRLYKVSKKIATKRKTFTSMSPNLEYKKYFFKRFF